MKASKVYNLLVNQGNGFISDDVSLSEYIDWLRSLSDNSPEIENLIFEVGLTTLKKYLKKEFLK